MAANSLFRVVAEPFEFENASAMRHAHRSPSGRATRPELNSASEFRPTESYRAFRGSLPVSNSLTRASAV